MKIQKRKDLHLKIFKYPRVFYLWILFLYCFLVFCDPQTLWSQPWWSKTTVEETREIEKGLQYERVLYETVLNEPVRAHILSVTNSNSPYIFGVLGSFGTVFTPSQFAHHSGALATINGSFYTKNPTRALGMVTAHGRVLYPPQNQNTFHGTVGFTPDNVLFGWIRPDHIVNNRIECASGEWNECHAALGAGPMLLLKGEKVIEKAGSNFKTTQRAPRTAIAKIRNGKVLMVVVDGRQPAWSAGVSLEELLEIFQARQATDALNLDGGGSSTMVINNEVVNRPSDGSFQGAPGMERAVVNVIALFRK